MAGLIDVGEGRATFALWQSNGFAWCDAPVLAKITRANGLKSWQARK